MALGSIAWLAFIFAAFRTDRHSINDLPDEDDDGNESAEIEEAGNSEVAGNAKEETNCAKHRVS